MSSIARLPSVVAPTHAPAASPSLEPRERPTGPPVFTRDAKAATSVKDKGVPREEIVLGRYLQQLGPVALQRWANLPATGRYVAMPALSGEEVSNPLLNQYNRMLIQRAGNGGLELGPEPTPGDDDLEMPHMRIQPAANGGVAVMLNGHAFDPLRAALPDLELAYNMYRAFFP